MRVKNELHAEIIAFLPRLRRFARALTGSVESGDDLVQETCLRALSRVDQFQSERRIDSWMFAIAKNLWLDQIRREKVRGDQIAFDEHESVGAVDGQKISDDRLTLADVDRAITGLPPELRVLVCLVCVDGRTYQETANIVGAPIGTVMSRLARARRKLHEQFGGAPLPGTQPTGPSHA